MRPAMLLFCILLTAVRRTETRDRNRVTAGIKTRHYEHILALFQQYTDAGLILKQPLHALYNDLSGINDSWSERGLNEVRTFFIT